FYGGRVGSDRKAPREFLFRRLEAQQHNAATGGVMLRDHPVDRAPGGAALLRLELPPVWPQTQSIQAFQNRSDRVLANRPVLAGDDLDHQLAANRACGIEDAQQLALL